MVLGDEGIITQAQQAKERYKEEEEKEAKALEDLMNKFEQVDDSRSIMSIAHAYYGERPQNSIAAYEAAVEDGLEYMECDLLFTADGVPVLSHNKDLAGNNVKNADGSDVDSSITIPDSTYTELLSYDFGVYYGPEYASTKILTLDDFLSFCKDNNVKPFIEIKDSYNTVEELETAYSLINNYGLVEVTIIESFFINELKKIQEIDDNFTFVLAQQDTVTEDSIEKVKSLMNGKNKVFIATNDTSDITLQLCKEEGISMIYYVINDSVFIENMDSYVSGIISDKYNAEKVLNNIYRVVRVITASELSQNKVPSNMNAPYNYSTNGRISYLDWDLLIDPGYMYKIEFESTVENPKIGVLRYTESAYQAYLNNESLNYWDSQWQDNGYTFNSSDLYQGEKLKVIRFQFKDNDGVATSDYITSVTISRKKVQ